VLGAALLATLSTSPSPFPLDFDKGEERLLLAYLTEAQFRAASFLDERILATGAPSTWITTDEVARLAAGLEGESDFIFHIGHVGSTLVSRLLGASERIFALREPAILRTLARRRAGEGGRSDPHLELALRLLSRVWRPGQRCLVKATSFVSAIAPAIMAASPSAKALAMFVSPQVHMATRLAGPASRAELPVAAEGWLDRLHRRLGGVFWRLDGLSEGERAALGWACELCALAVLVEQFPVRVRWLDFDRFLAQPAVGLASALTFLRGEPLGGEVAAMLRSGDLGRYSKAPEFNYDARTRRDVIDDGMRAHAVEIERGIAWLNAAGNSHPIIARAATSAAIAVRVG
jgi:hypothetical protein